MDLSRSSMYSIEAHTTSYQAAGSTYWKSDGDIAAESRTGHLHIGEQTFPFPIHSELLPLCLAPRSVPATLKLYRLNCNYQECTFPDCDHWVFFSPKAGWLLELDVESTNRGSTFLRRV
jgi:hypothetical protein